MLPKRSILALGALIAFLLCLTACGNGEMRAIPEGQAVFALSASPALCGEVHAGDIVGVYDGGTAITQLRYVQVYAASENTLLLLLCDSQVRALYGASDAAVALVSCSDAQRAEELLALQSQLNAQDAAPVTEPPVPVTEPITEPVTAPVTEPIGEPVTEPVTQPVTEPVIPMPAEPTKPVTEPTEPSKPTNPTEPAKPTEPTTPTTPTESKPTKPVVPGETDLPIAIPIPTFPIRPVPGIPIDPPPKQPK